MLKGLLLDIFNNYKKLREMDDTQLVIDFAKKQRAEFKEIIFNEFGLNEDIYKIAVEKGGAGNNFPIIAWAAVLDRRITEKPKEGIYIVYLFNADYSKVYLTLNQGCTALSENPNKTSILLETAIKVRKFIDKGSFLDDDKINLGAHKTAKDYQDGCIFYKEYERDDLPDDDELKYDLFESVKIYNSYYEKLQGGNIAMRNEHDSNIIKINFKINEFMLNNYFAEKYVNSLLSNPFTILAGNSGTGKTKIAKDLATWLGKPNPQNSEDIQNKLIVPVGADWTDNTKILGFYNSLKKTYESTKILDFILRAGKKENESIPFFLILDEMNLSHVERYFSDFLSAMESHEKIILYRKDDDCDSDIPDTIKLPENLFVTGTVNIDETTYMFSPKVLDRANVIEFIPEQADVLANFENETQPEEIVPANDGSAEGFLDLAKKVRATKSLPSGSAKCKEILGGISNILEGSGFEFAFRTAKEIRLYINAANMLAQNEGKPLEDKQYINLMDEQLLQKVLPKIHGNRNQVGKLLSDLSIYAEEQKLYNSKKKLDKMLKQLETSQFTSFI